MTSSGGRTHPYTGRLVCKSLKEKRSATSTCDDRGDRRTRWRSR
jgi:hypothetical protein